MRFLCKYEPQDQNYQRSEHWMFELHFEHLTSLDRVCPRSVDKSDMWQIESTIVWLGVEYQIVGRSDPMR